MENLNLCLTILITGFAVVFSVLILLILIIKIYGTIVTKALSFADAKKAQKQKALTEAPRQEPTAPPEQTTHEVSEGVSPEVVAVIAAAVDSTFGEGKARITKIKRSKTPNSRPAWGMAGVFENTKPF